MNQAELLERVRAVQALAERGAPGERENAAAILENLMNKYGLTESDIEAERVEMAWFRYRSRCEARLLAQVIVMVTGPRDMYERRNRQNGRTTKEVGVECSSAQRLEIEMSFSFYKAAFEQESEKLLTAFIHKNRMFPPPELVKDKDDPPARELSPEEHMKLMFLINGMDEHTMRKMIGGTTE